MHPHLRLKYLARRIYAGLVLSFERTVRWVREQVHLDVRGTMETRDREVKTSEASVRALGWGPWQETSAGGAVRMTEDASLGRLRVLVEVDV